MQLLHQHIARDGFRLRGVDLARIDAFSDVVFGFALTLLVVSLEVPKTYPELLETLHGFVPFAISFLLLMVVWYAHYCYFRRFGTHDEGTIAINAVLLFVILFYVYPLKFLFSFVAMAVRGEAHVFTEVHQLAHLMVIYGVGFFAIYALLTGLYLNGYRQRRALELSALECMLTRYYILELAGAACVGILSCVLALLLPPSSAGMAGYTYILIWPLNTISRNRSRARARAMLAREHATAEPAEATEAV